MTTLAELLKEAPALAARLARVRDFGRSVRNSEYHVTNTCNIRCQGCWFFSYEFDQSTEEQDDLVAWKDFIAAERARGITSALLIGGEPTLFPKRVACFVDAMPFVTVSSNGIKKLPKSGFENVGIALTLFGGGELDDELRAIRPDGRRFSGLFQRTLKNYRNDDRATFIYALSEDSAPNIEPTVRAIADNGNRVTFNFYTAYGSSDVMQSSQRRQAVLEEALRVTEAYRDAVICDPYYTRTLLSGETEWGKFGYDVCPSISVGNAVHAARLANGNRVLPLFNSYASDLKTLNFCCTSGHCEGCRDSQAVYSWLLVSFEHFCSSPERLETWLRVAEGYWAQWVWSPFGARNTDHGR